MANKKFTSVKNDFCITFDMKTNIERQTDDGSISLYSFDFTPIDQIKSMMQSKIVDIVGIVTAIEDKEQVKLKSGDSKSRKYLEVTDNTMHSIGISLWGDGLCDKTHDLNVGQLVAFKGVRLSDYNGKSLNGSQEQSQVYTEVDDDAARRVMRWFN